MFIRFKFSVGQGGGVAYWEKEYFRQEQLYLFFLQWGIKNVMQSNTLVFKRWGKND